MLLGSESFEQAIKNNVILARIIYALVFVIIGLVIAIIIMMPLKEIKTELYEFSSSGQTFYRIASSEDLVNRKVALVRFGLRRYIMDKEGIDNITETDRFTRVENMSSDEVHKQFKNRYYATRDKYKGVKRKITIELDTPFANDFSKKVHIVDFAVTDSKLNEKTTTYWQATIAYDFAEQKVRLDDLIQNPLGIEVESYSITKRNSINDLKK
jgi:type IV secretory pathway component VirB8